MKKKILAIIPARGGSKGIPDKNIRNICGKPLISWTIEQAKNCEYIDKVLVSTDDEEIAEISRIYGVEVPFLRPKELAKDDSPTIDAILHSLNFLEEINYIPEIVVLLQPTSPLRLVKDINNSIEQFLEKKYDSIISVCNFDHSPYWSLRIDSDYLNPAFGEDYFETRRQDLPILYHPNGAIFISNPSNLKMFKSFLCEKAGAYIMPSERSFDIDNELDFLLVEFLMKKRDQMSF